jgi:hypothetical protein
MDKPSRGIPTLLCMSLRAMTEQTLRTPLGRCLAFPHRAVRRVTRERPLCGFLSPGNIWQQTLTVSLASDIHSHMPPLPPLLRVGAATLVSRITAVQTASGRAAERGKRR